ncbi:MAG: hypothetical protein AAFV95_10210 [Bacteroidota bacterium]
MVIFPEDIKGNPKVHKTIKNNLLDEILHFNEAGMVSKTEYFREGIPSSSIEEEAKDGMIFRKIIEYDPRGKIKRRADVILDSNFKTIKATIFDGEGKVIQRTKNTVNEDNKVTEAIVGDMTYRYAYDSKGNQLSKVKLNEEGGIEKTQVSTYDERGNEIAWKKFDKKGKLVRYHLYQYNAEDKLIRKTKFERPEMIYPSTHQKSDFLEYYEMMKAFAYDVNGQETASDPTIRYLDIDTIYEYDQFGNTSLMEEYQYREDFSNRFLTLWVGEYEEYNEKNLIVKERSEETHTDWDWGAERTYTYDFDDTGKVICKKMGNGSTTDYQYDELGWLQKEKTTERTEGCLREEETEYDAKGNVIRHREISEYAEGETRDCLTVFDIEYYD